MSETNVSMTLCNWQICHQTHVLCGRTTFVPNQIRYLAFFYDWNYRATSRKVCLGPGMEIQVTTKLFCLKTRTPKYPHVRVEA